MSSYGYSGSSDATCSRAVGLALPVSLKIGVELCRELKGKKLDKAKVYLENVMKLKQAVPMKRYFQEVAHKPGMAVGKFPIKAAEHVLGIVKSAEANARSRGLDVTSMYLHHAVAQRAHTAHHYGRLGRKAKRTHIEIILKTAVKKAETKATKPAKAEKQPKKAAQVHA